MFSKSEKTILNIIKVVPVIPLIIFSLIITFMVIEEKKDDLQRDTENLRVKYINEHKVLVENEITQVVNLINIEIMKSEETLKEFIKDKVYQAHKVATSIYDEASKSEGKSHYLTDKQILETIKYALTGMSYNDNRGYFFMDDITGTKLLQPFNKSFEGKNFSEFEDPTGYKFIKKRIEVIKNKSESFDQYYWYKPNDKVNLYKKFSFYKYFEPFNISIGTGEYIVDFEKNLKENVLKWIKKVRKGKDSYIFIFDTKGNFLSHIKEDFIGTNRLEYQDENGNYIIKNIRDFAQKNGEGFINYYAGYSGGFNSSNKMSFVKLLDKWDWIIGTGFYLDSVEAEIKQKEEELIIENKLIINKIVTISLFLTLILIAITFYISNIIAKKFTRYKENIMTEMNKTLEKEKLLVQQSKMAMMGEMIDNIAHQWKQPLSLIRMSNQLIKLDKETGGTLYDEKTLNESIDNIDNSVEHLSTTIDDFRNFFNPNKGKTHFKMNEAFERTFKLLNSELKKSNIEVVKNIKDVKVNGYQNELIQVFINIIKNAKDEFVKKEENEVKQYIFINVFETEVDIQIKIKDTCGGIPNGIVNNIFRAHFTTKEDQGGSGIGLYMSKQIIEGMHGTLDVSNQVFVYEGIEYKGAEFTIIIPKNYV